MLTGSRVSENAINNDLMGTIQPDTVADSCCCYDVSGGGNDIVSENIRFERPDENAGPVFSDFPPLGPIPKNSVKVIQLHKCKITLLQ